MSDHAPKKILSLAPCVTEILAELGRPQGVTTLTDFWEDRSPVSDVSKGEEWFAAALQKVAAFEPDLIFTYSLSQQVLAKKLRETGFSVVHLDPLRLQDVEDGFLQVGKAVGAYDDARKLSQDFNDGLRALADKVPPGAYRPKLYCEELVKPPLVPGRWWPDLMTKVGAHYFPILSREVNRQAKLEEVLKFDPDIIIFSVYGSGKGFNPDEALKRIGWEKIMAVRKRKVYSLDPDCLNWPTPRLLAGAQAVQSALGESYWGWPLVDPGQARRVTN